MRTGITLLLLVTAFTVTAQHKKTFFNTVYFSVMAGDETYEVDRKQWKNMYANRPLIPYQLDTMTFDYMSAPKDGFLFPLLNGSASSVSIGKSLIDKQTGWWHRRTLEWRSTIHFKSTFYNPIRYGGYASLLYPMDTTKPNMQTNVSLSQTKKILEWQNLINFKTKPILKNKYRFSIGSGIGISRTLKNIIKEKLNQTTYIWNPALRYFMSQSSSYNETDFKAKSETHLLYIFYMGSEIKLSSQISFIGDFHYTLAHNKYSSGNPKTESYWFGLTFSYSFN